MNRSAFILLLLAGSAWPDDTIPFSLRGRPQTLIRIQPSAQATQGTVIFLPGDGGWRGAAVMMARTIASFGYDVYAIDTRNYLETFSQNGARLSQEQLAADVRTLAGRASGASAKPTILVGWSQGAGMAVAAVAANTLGSPIRGVITLGLPESAVLGWDWKATVAALAKRDPDQPSFAVKPLLGNITPTPLWMIHGTQDEYTSMEAARDLYKSVNEPKRFEEIAGADHRFGGHEDELYRSLKAGLQWIVSR